MKINGIDASTYGFVLGSAQGAADAPSRQTPRANIAKRGSRAVGRSIHLPRRITLNGTVRGSSASVARNRLDLLEMALSTEPVRLIFDDHTDRHIDALLDSFAVPPREMGSAITKVFSVGVVLTADDPFFYDTSETVSSSSVPLGTAPTRPRITLTPTVAAPPWFIDLKNYAGATVATMTIDIAAAGETFVIDADTQTLTKAGTSILDKLSGDFFYIDPAILADYPNSSWPTIVGRSIDSGGTLDIRYRRAWR
jgi:phage-related protein